MSRGGEQASKYYFISWYRVIGMFLVCWPHFAAVYNPAWPVLQGVQWFINRPLDIMQNFGGLGVSIFFLISGFLAAENKDKALDFCVKKFTRTIIPIWISMAIFYALQKVLQLFGYKSYWVEFPIISWVKSAGLYCVFNGEGDGVNGVLWYMFVLTMFYVLQAVFKLLFGAQVPIQFLICIGAFMVGVYGFAEHLPKGIPSFTPFLTIIIWGYIINLWYKEKISKKKALLAGVGFYALMITGYWLYYPAYYETERYTLSAVIALMLFIIGLLSERLDKPKVGEIVLFLDRISYSFYLTHTLYGGLIIQILTPRLPFTLCFVLAVCGSIIAGYVNYTVAERPAIVLGKRIQKYERIIV